MLRALAVLLVATLLLATAPTAQAGQPCTTPPKDRVAALLWAAECAVERLPADELEPGVATVEVDLRSLTACPGPWGHEERTQVGPVVVVTYACDGGGA